MHFAEGLSSELRDETKTKEKEESEWESAWLVDAHYSSERGGLRMCIYNIYINLYHTLYYNRFILYIIVVNKSTNSRENCEIC